MAQTRVQVIIDAVNNASKVFKGMESDMKSVGDSLKSLAISGAAVGAATTLMGKQFVNAAVQMQNSMLGLSTVANAFGSNADDATMAAEQLASDGLMSVADAASGLKNLLATGFSLPEAITLMNAFRDSAAFNRQGSLEFGQAIVGATEGLKNQNSIMVDNAGVTKNLSVILKEAGFSQQDLMNVTTDASVRQALFNGILKETSAFQGDAARASDALQGSLARLNTKTFLLKAQFGEALAPALVETINQIEPLITKMTELAAAHPEVVVQVFKLLTGIGLLSTAYLTSIPVVKAFNNIVKITGIVSKGSLIGVGKLTAALFSLGKVKSAGDAILAIRLALISIQGAMGGAVTAVVSGLSAMGTAFLGFAATLLANPITWIILAIIAVVALLVVAWRNNWGDIQGKTQAVIQAIGTWLQNAKQWISDFVTNAVERFNAFVTAIVEIPAKIGEMFMTFLGIIETFRQNVITKLEEFKAKVIEFFTWENLMVLWEQFWFNLGFIVGNFFAVLLIDIPTFLGELLLKFVEWITNLTTAFLEFFTVTIPTLWNNFVAFMTEEVPRLGMMFVNWIIEMVTGAWQAIHHWATVTVPEAIASLIQWLSVEIPRLKENFIQWITEMVNKAHEWLIWMKENAISTIKEMIANLIAATIAFVARMIAGFVQMVGDIANAVWQLPGRIAAAMNAVKEKAVAKAIEIYNGVKEWFDKIVGFFDNIIGKAGEAISKAKEAFSLGFSGGFSRQTGGTIPGAIGEAVPTMMHAGERVIPAGVDVSSGNGGGGIVFNVSIGMYAGTETEKRNVARDLYAALLQVAQAQNKSVAELMGG